MRISPGVARSAILLALVTGIALPAVRADARLHSVTSARQTPEETASGTENATIKPEVAALLKTSTAVYAAMKSYRHNSEYFSKTQDADNEVHKTIVFTLALERPNKFCYKADVPAFGAAICDGKTFLNYHLDGAISEREHTYYTKTTAPVNYKGINIVDDVTFTHGSYMIALMLQGNVMADKDVEAGLKKATLHANVEENGKKYDVLSVPFPGHIGPEFKTHSLHFYFDTATHLLHKAVEDVPAEESDTHAPYKMLEIIENVLIDKPMPPNTFEYKLPKNARQVVGLPVNASHSIAAGR